MTAVDLFPPGARALLGLPACLKVAHRTRDDARVALREARRFGAVRFYRCRCGAFHLSRKPQT